MTDGHAQPGVLDSEATAGLTVPGARLLLGASEVGKLLGVGRSTVWTWHAGGVLPAPVKVGGLTRWRADELCAWVAAGCPGRTAWAIRKGT